MHPPRRGDARGLYGRREAEAFCLIEATIEERAQAAGKGRTQVCHWSAAVLYNGLGRYQEALRRPAGERGGAGTVPFGWALSS